METMRGTLRTVGWLGAAGAAGLAYALWEATQYTLRRVTLPVLTAGAPDLRVLHLSDVHLTPNQPAKVEWLRALGELKPDLVVNTGDNLATPDSVPVVLDAYEPLFDVPGVYVFGSNDYYAARPKNPARYLLPDNRRRIHGRDLPWDDLDAAFTAAGWANVSNARRTLTVADRRLAIVGVDDPHLDLDRYPEPDPLWGSDAVVRLGVSHAPYLRVIDAMAADHADLVLAGHTHGGQLRVPGFGAIVTNCDLPRAQASGLSRHGAAWLHVSAGLGTSPYTPVRFACRPEATLLTLQGSATTG
jgi:predicted MPP superfamily phosphohydrolase